MGSSAPSCLRTRDTCRLCDSRDLQRLFSLGQTPLANEFVTPEARGEPQERFPLTVYLCGTCRHVQLLDVVDPERLFRDYVYVSATSPVFVEHFRRYAQHLLALTAMRPGAQVVEIGSNDGTLLRFFQEAGMEVLGIDPARDIAAQATARGIETRPEFFDQALAQRLRQEGWQPALIAANNVFAHVDDPQGIVEGVRQLLAADGVFVFEVSYLRDVVEKTLFDTIYHEHLSYHTVKPLVGLFARHGMELVDALRVDAHGGSLRAVAKHAGGPMPKQPGVEQLVAEEARLGLHEPAAYERLFANVQTRKRELTSLLRELRGQGKRIAGFGAPAKATTLMFHFGLGPDALEYLIDDSPWKQGRLSPGHHLPVVPSSHLYGAATRPDYALVLAWNFADSIIQKHQAYRDGGGRFIVPLPEIRVV